MELTPKFLVRGPTFFLMSAPLFPSVQRKTVTLGAKVAPRRSLVARLGPHVGLLLFFAQFFPLFAANFAVLAAFFPDDFFWILLLVRRFEGNERRCRSLLSCR